MTAAAIDRAIRAGAGRHRPNHADSPAFEVTTNRSGYEVWGIPLTDDTADQRARAWAADRVARGETLVSIWINPGPVCRPLALPPSHPAE